jgi:Fur family ferric uptake transcriptional regulator
MDTLLQTAQEKLLLQGGRMTSQRRCILETLASQPDHPTAEELFQIVKQSDPTINLSTVYRTLRWLEQEGLVNARRFDDHHHHEHFDPVQLGEHYHFYCTICQKIIEFDDPEIDALVENLQPKLGVTILSTTMIVNGICPECADK